MTLGKKLWDGLACTERDSEKENRETPVEQTTPVPRAHTPAPIPCNQLRVMHSSCQLRRNDPLPLQSRKQQPSSSKEHYLDVCLAALGSTTSFMRLYSYLSPVFILKWHRRKYVFQVIAFAHRMQKRPPYLKMLASIRL